MNLCAHVVRVNRSGPAAQPKWLVLVVAALWPAVSSACSGSESHGANAGNDAAMTSQPDVRAVDGLGGGFDAFRDGAPHSPFAGSIGGVVLAGRAAVTVDARVGGFGFNGTSTVIELADIDGACAKEAMNAGSKGAHRLIFGLGNIDGGGVAHAPADNGRYDVAGGDGALKVPLSRGAVVFFETDGDDCKRVAETRATEGVVVVTGSDGEGVAIDYDVLFPSGDEVVGSFKASPCPDLNPNRTPLATCQ